MGHNPFTFAPGGFNMHKTSTLTACLIAAALMAWPLAQVQAQTMSKADYKAASSRIGADYKADRAACESFSGNAKDICIEQAKAKEKVALADLEYGYSGKPTDQNKLRVAMAESDYAVAKERCDDKAGNSKDVCVQEAKAVMAKALADAKLGKQIGQARTDASREKLDADYKVAAEKCESLAGDAKSACIAAAKARFGKS
jgi:hypothetical protein